MALGGLVLLCVAQHTWSRSSYIKHLLLQLHGAQKTSKNWEAEVKKLLSGSNKSID